MMIIVIIITMKVVLMKATMETIGVITARKRACHTTKYGFAMVNLFNVTGW